MAYAVTTHRTIQRQLKSKLERCLRYGGFEDADASVSTEVTHEAQDLPSEKSSCRTDVELRLPNETLAFEIKMSKSDCVNWFTQRRDYRYVGLSPVLVVSKKLAFYLAPHHKKTLSGSYVVWDEYESDWFWQHDCVPNGVRSEFSVSDPITFVDECPECGCWTKADYPVIHCANCHWRASDDRLKESDSLVDACWKCGDHR